MGSGHRAGSHLGAGNLREAAGSRGVGAAGNRATAAVLVGALSRLGRLGTLRGSVDTASQGGNTNGRSGDLLQAQRAASLGLGGRGRSSGSQGEQSENSRELHRWLVVVEEGWRVGCWWFQAHPQAGRGSPFIPEGFPFFPSQGEMR